MAGSCIEAVRLLIEPATDGVFLAALGPIGRAGVEGVLAGVIEKSATFVAKDVGGAEIRRDAWRDGIALESFGLGFPGMGVASGDLLSPLGESGDMGPEGRPFTKSEEDLTG